MSKGKNISKGKEQSKSKSISKLGFAVQKVKKPVKYHDTFMLIDGKMDKSVKARFTSEEIKRMRERSDKYSLFINKSDVGSRISMAEWEKMDERVNWDEYLLITQSGKKIKLLATSKESDKGISRVEPSWKSRKKKEKTVVSGQQRLFEG